MAEKMILTGVKPTGALHMGNYFGTIKQMLDLEKEGNLVLFIADLHALTNLDNNAEQHDADTFASLVEDTIRSYVAFGINPKKTIIYNQSEFPQITELNWIFCCMLKQQFLTIGHAFKDVQQRGEQPGLGTFLYPVLMAADILLPGADIVPVGKDQVQHIEIAREIARKFNTITGTTYFKEPQERVMENTAIIPGINGEKMSKSKRNTIPIFGDEKIIRQSIANIITDSTPAGNPIQPEKCILCTYLKLVLNPKEYGDIENKCLGGKITYKELKEILAEAYLNYFKEEREQYVFLEKNTNKINRITQEHRKRIDTHLTTRLNEVRKILGLSIPQKNTFLFSRT